MHYITSLSYDFLTVLFNFISLLFRFLPYFLPYLVAHLFSSSQLFSCMSLFPFSFNTSFELCFPGNFLLSYDSIVESTQMSLEDSFVNYASSTGQDSVILCDRGVMDGQAYVAEDTWRTVLQVRTYKKFLHHDFPFFIILRASS